MAEYGYCQCGCGEKTKLFKYDNKKRGNIKGEPSNFIPGHIQKLKRSICSIPECGKKTHARKLCRLHYMRKWHTGDVFAEKPSQSGPKDIVDRKVGRWSVIDIAEKGSDGSYYWNCVCDCGTKRKIRSAVLRNGSSMSCGCLVSDMRKKQIGPLASNWKGGTRTNYGYKMVRGYGHPNTLKDGYILEHRKIMSDIIGRPLERHELVHHKNGIRDDNRPENLELLTHSDHMGIVQCPHCQKEFQLK